MARSAQVTELLSAIGMMACWWRRVKMRVREWRERRTRGRERAKAKKDWVCDARAPHMTDCDGWWLFGASVSGRNAADATSSSFTISLPPFTMDILLTCTSPRSIPFLFHPSFLPFLTCPPVAFFPPFLVYVH